MDKIYNRIAINKYVKHIDGRHEAILLLWICQHPSQLQRIQQHLFVRIQTDWMSTASKSIERIDNRLVAETKKICLYGKVV